MSFFDCAMGSLNRGAPRPSETHPFVNRREMAEPSPPKPLQAGRKRNEEYHPPGIEASTFGKCQRFFQFIAPLAKNSVIALTSRRVSASTVHHPRWMQESWVGPCPRPSRGGTHAAKRVCGCTSRKKQSPNFQVGVGGRSRRKPRSAGRIKQGPSDPAGHSITSRIATAHPGPGSDGRQKGHVSEPAAATWEAERCRACRRPLLKGTARRAPTKTLAQT